MLFLFSIFDGKKKNLSIVTKQKKRENFQFKSADGLQINSFTTVFKCLKFKVCFFDSPHRIFCLLNLQKINRSRSMGEKIRSCEKNAQTGKMQICCFFTVNVLKIGSWFYSTTVPIHGWLKTLENICGFYCLKIPILVFFG